jgi:hypothetical protein
MPQLMVLAQSASPDHHLQVMFKNKYRPRFFVDGFFYGGSTFVNQGFTYLFKHVVVLAFLIGTGIIRVLPNERS